MLRAAHDKGEFGGWNEWGKKMLATSCEREQCLLGPQPDHCLAQGMVVEGSRAGRVLFSQSQTF